MACNKNPYEGYLTKVFNYMNANPGAYLNEVMTSGFTGSTSVYCCPDCSDVSFICNNVRFWRYYNAWDEDGCILNQTCCINYVVSVSDYSNFIEVGIPVENQCCDGFNDCVITNLTDVIGCDPIESGLIEYSTVQDSTNTCIIADILSQYDQTTAYNYFVQLMDIGVVIYCDGDNVYGTTLDGYSSWFCPGL
jgi:hypothetical protein